MSIAFKMQVISSIDLSGNEIITKKDMKSDNTEVMTRNLECQANLPRNILLSKIGTHGVHKRHNLVAYMHFLSHFINPSAPFE